MKIASISKIAYINEALNNYRDHPNNASKREPRSFRYLRELFELYNWIFTTIEIENKKVVIDYFNGYIKQACPKFKPDSIIEWVGLFSINRHLFFQSIKFKFITSPISACKKMKRIVL